MESNANTSDDVVHNTAQNLQTQSTESTQDNLIVAPKNQFTVKHYDDNRVNTSETSGDHAPELFQSDGVAASPNQGSISIEDIQAALNHETIQPLLDSVVMSSSNGLSANDSDAKQEAKSVEDEKFISEAINASMVKAEPADKKSHEAEAAAVSSGNGEPTVLKQADPATVQELRTALDELSVNQQGTQSTNPWLKPRDVSKHKKSKKKSSGQKKPKATGFEDYYVDTPLTPDEHREERSLYDSEKSFPERFLLAIARYSKRRNLDEFRSKIFDKYMAYGGLNTGIKAFQGRVDEKAPDTTAIDAAIQKSKYYVKDETIENSVVDFNGVVRGFLSSYLPAVYETHRSEDVKACTNVVRNFLNYLLQHDVCPEYADQIYDARASCDEAELQLPVCSKLARDLPGTFNQACSILFGGYYSKIYIEDIEQAKAFNVDPGMRSDQAAKIFLAGLAAQGSSQMVADYNTQAAIDSVAITTEKEGYLEVLSVTAPTPEVLEMYSLPSQRSFRPIGLVKFLTWRHPNGPWPEMTPEQVSAFKLAPYPRDEVQMFVDVDMLPYLKKGTKFWCSYRKTSFGVWYFDGVMSVLSPMYTWLMNEPMLDWVEHKELPWKPRSWAVGLEDGEEGGVGAVVSGDDSGGGDGGGGQKQDDDGDSDGEDLSSGFKNCEKGEDIVLSI